MILASGVVVGLAAARMPANAAAEVRVFVNSSRTFPSPSSQAASQPASTSAPASEPAEVVWRTALADGIEQARVRRQPILAIAGARWCSWCRKLEKELESEALQPELARWTLVRFDVDKTPGDARTLAVGPVPALRVLTSSGRVLATHDGYLPAKELLTWLRGEYEKAELVPVEGLTDDKPPDKAALKKLLRALGHRDAILREAAIGRLAPHAELAAADVVRLATKGTLGERLSALELLRGWQAPIADLDPWDPNGSPEERMAELRDWAADAGTTASQPVATADPAELESLLQAPSAAEADVIAARLARSGRDLLPLVIQRLRAATTDEQRERLTALRYRLVAPTRLPLDWPGGLARLASRDATQRQAAAAELAQRATAADSALLRELFSDLDPLVREISLRALRTVGGAEGIAALVELLADPEPNVRAAVLKELAENPTANQIERVAEYVANEADPDLLVHAIRVLRKARKPTGVTPLIQLLEHENWRVRAEAAEGLRELTNLSESNVRADIYAALIKRLDDPDGFVVAQAAQGLAGVELPAAGPPLLRAARAHPEIAADVLRILQKPELGKTVAAELPGLLDSESPQLRAAAVNAMTALGPEVAREAVLKALQDADLQVRMAGARWLYAAQMKQRPDNWHQSRDRAATQEWYSDYSERESATSPSPHDVTKWLEELAAGKHVIAWAAEAVPALEILLAAETREAQYTAALALIALGHTETGLPGVQAVLAQDTDLPAGAFDVFAWLPPEPRQALFDAVTRRGLEEQQRADLADALASLPDTTSAELLWKLLGDPALSNMGAGQLQSALRFTYLGERYYNDSDVSSAARKRMAKAARTHLTEGSELQRLVALSLLGSADPEQGRPAAQRLADDEAASPALRADAMRMYLAIAEPDDAQKAALAALARDNERERAIAVRFLATGSPGTVRDVILLQESISYGYSSSGTPIEPEPPTGLKADSVRPLLASTDAEVTACAGYLLALLGEADGFERLVAFWRSAHNDDTWTRLVYRAVVALKDDARTPLLDEIYKGYGKDTWRLREFYWTIRSMKGPQVLALRKRIRDEVGMDSLR